MSQKVELEYVELPYAINEEIKTLRTNLQFTGADKKVLLITSAVSNEGKSTTALNLARSFAELGKKVLLIDADLRKSVLEEKIVDGEVKYGLTHFLSGQCEIEDIMYEAVKDNIYVFFAGAYPPNPAELLATGRMKDLLSSVRRVFDYVIVDCAPLGLVIDSAVVAPYCDGGVVVLNAGEIKYKLAQEVKKKLEATGTPILGVVLNQVNHQSNGRYYGKKYGYYSYKKYEKYEN